MQSKPKFKVCRRLGPGIYDKCQTQKFALAEQRFQKTNRKRRPSPRSDFATQQLEKQRVRFTYGVAEKYLARLVREAVGQKKIPATDALYRSVESRLDNVVYRMGLALSRRHARQLVSHGLIAVNGKRLSIPSHRITSGDAIGVHEGKAEKKVFAHIGSGEGEDRTLPAWVTFDPSKKAGEVVGTPTPLESDLGFDLRAVVEFYSR